MTSQAERLVALEPWRENAGQPRNALDPAWDGLDRRECDGSIEFEIVDGQATGWWFCHGCGYCGRSSTQRHKAVQHPAEYFFHSLLFFYRRRATQNLSVHQTTQQAFFIAGAALRYAAAKPPDSFKQFTHAVTSA